MRCPQAGVCQDASGNPQEAVGLEDLDAWKSLAQWWLNWVDVLPFFFSTTHQDGLVQDGSTFRLELPVLPFSFENPPRCLGHVAMAREAGA